MKTRQLLLFEMDGGRYAVEISAVVEVAQAVRVHPLPSCAAVVEGVVAYRGGPLPLFSLRRCLQLPERPAEPGDHLIVVRLRGRRAALRVDRIVGPEAIPAGSVTDAAALATDAGRPLAGVAQFEDGLILICDLEAFLTEAEDATLRSSLEGVRL